MSQTDNVSIALLAEMSQVAYEDEPRMVSSKWVPVETFRTNYAFSVLFHCPSSNHFVLANRGTDDYFDTEMVNNFSMAGAERTPVEIQEALHQFGLDDTIFKHAHETSLRAAAIVGPRDFYVTGHSQGGTLAILQSIMRGLPGVVFNPMTPVNIPDLWDRMDPTRFITVRAHGDIAGKATRRTVGRLIEVGLVLKNELPCSIALGILPQNMMMWYAINVVSRAVRAHQIEPLVQQILIDPAFQDDLGWVQSHGMTK